MQSLWTALLSALLTVVLGGLGVFLMRSHILRYGVHRPLVRLLKDEYSENLWDLVIGTYRMTPHLLMETELRAEFGEPLERPIGGFVNAPGLAGIAFNPAQIVRESLGPDVSVDLSVTLGPRCRRPLRLDLPILVPGMGYGIGVSRNFALAMAKGASAAGTAYNSGIGPVLPEVAEAARHLIVQYTGSPWTQDPHVISQADMVEIRIGHGARASLGRRLKPQDLLPEVREAMGIAHHRREDIIIEMPPPEAKSLPELRRLVRYLYDLLDGGPVGVKIACTDDIERELAFFLEAGVHIIALDGAEGGTHGAPPAVADDFGLPTIHGLCRVVRYLDRVGARDEVQLIASGGLRTPGEALKALALGADAVYMGSAAMMSVTHALVSKSVPFEPVTQLVWVGGQRTHMLDPEEGGKTLANFLKSAAGEMQEALRALGMCSIAELSPDVLIARDPATAEVTGLPPSWRSPGERARRGRGSRGFGGIHLRRG